jgi:hypothetical protein
LASILQRCPTTPHNRDVPGANKLPDGYLLRLRIVEFELIGETAGIQNAGTHVYSSWTGTQVEECRTLLHLSVCTVLLLRSSVGVQTKHGRRLELRAAEQ